MRFRTSRIPRFVQQVEVRLEAGEFEDARNSAPNADGRSLRCRRAPCPFRRERSRCRPRTTGSTATLSVSRSPDLNREGLLPVAGRPVDPGHPGPGQWRSPTVKRGLRQFDLGHRFIVAALSRVGVGQLDVPPDPVGMEGDGRGELADGPFVVPHEHADECHGMSRVGRNRVQPPGPLRHLQGLGQAILRCPGSRRIPGVGRPVPAPPRRRGGGPHPPLPSPSRTPASCRERSGPRGGRDRGGRRFGPRPGPVAWLPAGPECCEGSESCRTRPARHGATRSLGRVPPLPPGTPLP